MLTENIKQSILSKNFQCVERKYEFMHEDAYVCIYLLNCILGRMPRIKNACD